MTDKDRRERFKEKQRQKTAAERIRETVQEVAALTVAWRRKNLGKDGFSKSTVEEEMIALRDRRSDELDVMLTTFIAETGLPPSQIVLVEAFDHQTSEWTFRFARRNDSADREQALMRIIQDLQVRLAMAAGGDRITLLMGSNLHPESGAGAIDALGVTPAFSSVGRNIPKADASKMIDALDHAVRRAEELQVENDRAGVLFQPPTTPILQETEEDRQNARRVAALIRIAEWGQIERLPDRSDEDEGGKGEEEER